MSLGGWAIGHGLFDWIWNNTDSNGLILEFGSGVGTAKLSEIRQIISIEHDIEWVSEAKSPIVYAPIKENWYDISIVDSLLSSINPHVLLIDGPPAQIGRAGILKLETSLFLSADYFIFDDTNRINDAQVCLSFLQKLVDYSLLCNDGDTFKTETLNDADKQFTVIKRIRK